MNKKWELNEANDALINKISEEFNVSKLVANIIANKGLTNSDEIEVFLHPRRTDFHDPFMMPDMEKAVDRVVNGNVCSNRYSVVKCMWRLVVWIRWKKKRTAGGII